jgi:hypothetical protein
MKSHVFFGLLLVLGSPAKSQMPSTAKSASDSDACSWLYVYRERNLLGALLSYNIYLDDSIVCHVKNNSKFKIKLIKEGKIKLVVGAAKTQGITLNVQVQCGQIYYLNCSLNREGGDGLPFLIHPAQGEVEYNSVEGRDSK